MQPASNHCAGWARCCLRDAREDSRDASILDGVGTLRHRRNLAIPFPPPPSTCPLRPVRDCAAHRSAPSLMAEGPERGSRRSHHAPKCGMAARAARSERRTLRGNPSQNGTLLGNARAPPVTCARESEGARCRARSDPFRLRVGVESSRSKAVAGQDSVVMTPPRRCATRFEAGVPGSASVGTRTRGDRSPRGVVRRSLDAATRIASGALPKGSASASSTAAPSAPL